MMLREKEKLRLRKTKRLAIVYRGGKSHWNSNPHLTNNLQK